MEWRSKMVPRMRQNRAGLPTKATMQLSCTQLEFGSAIALRATWRMGWSRQADSRRSEWRGRTVHGREMTVTECAAGCRAGSRQTDETSPLQNTITTPIISRTTVFNKLRNISTADNTQYSTKHGHILGLSLSNRYECTRIKIIVPLNLS